MAWTTMYDTLITTMTICAFIITRILYIVSFHTSLCYLYGMTSKHTAVVGMVSAILHAYLADLPIAVFVWVCACVVFLLSQTYAGCSAAQAVLMTGTIAVSTASSVRGLVWPEHFWPAISKKHSIYILCAFYFCLSIFIIMMHLSMLCVLWPGKKTHWMSMWLNCDKQPKKFFFSEMYIDTFTLSKCK